MKIYQKCREMPTVKVKRHMWAKLLTTASGTNFTDEDWLFVDHTLLVAMAEVIGHAVVGFQPDDPDISAAMLMAGDRFSNSQISGVVESDFFDWIVYLPDGERFIIDLARRLTRFAWDQVEHDVMKILYESIIPPETRHLLGEYYTPDWLAEEIIAKCVDDPLSQRVLDASCGSGTFLFHAIRHYIAAAVAAGRTNSEILEGVARHIIGFDVHPVAVTLARVTYLLAIGLERLQDDRPEFSVPVYLGDSLLWGKESTLVSDNSLDVPTDLNHETFVNDPEPYGRSTSTEFLRFPDRIVADAASFDRLVTELADKSANRRPGDPIPSLTAVFQRFKIHNDKDRSELEQTFTTMCRLHDAGKDHIWGYYVRNLARPVWLARPDNRVDVLVGNPPWLAYRYMTHNQQVSFRRMSLERGLWAGATVATNQDLSALFVARCIERYLQPGGRFGYVMPLAVLSRRQYTGFRTGHYPVQAEPVTVAFDQPWDLHQIKPIFFRQSVGVILGRRRNSTATAVPLNQVPQIWSGKFSTKAASRDEAVPHISRITGEPPPPQRVSPYATRFSQGATVVPRFLFLITSRSPGPLGTGAGRRAIQSRRSALEKKPWKDLPPLRGTVESRFIRPLYLGDSVLPFHLLEPHEAVIPRDGERLLHRNDERLDAYPGLAKWWRSAEAIWNQNRKSKRLSLLERLDYRRGLSGQFPASAYRVVYSKSGMYLAAAIIQDRDAVIDHKLYWGTANSHDEARYLTSILNSTTLTLAVRHLQGRGEHNPRDFDKYVFELPIPPYDPNNPAHQQLVALAERAEHTAAHVTLPPRRFETQRRRIREALAIDGVSTEIDAIVKTLLS
jgi:N-6 DNA Methylase